MLPEILSSAFIGRASEQLPWFAAVLLVSAAIVSLVSSERRRRLGLTKFLFGYLCIAAMPLFGVIVLRSALREGLEQAGHGPAATSGATGWHAGSAAARAIDDALNTTATSWQA